MWFVGVFVFCSFVLGCMGVVEVSLFWFGLGCWDCCGLVLVDWGGVVLVWCGELEVVECLVVVM